MNRNASSNTQHPTDNEQPKAGCLPLFVVRWVLGVVTCVRLLALLAFALPAFAQDPRAIVEEAQRRSMSMSQRYEGTLRVINDKNKIAEKRWSFERIGSHGDSKSILRFTAPAEVKGVALLVVNHTDRSSDQWMWTPAVGRERRIALQDRSQRFFGTDFSFEDLEERDTHQFDYRQLADEALDGMTCWKIESRPKEKKVSQYTHSWVWIRKDNYVVVQIENYKKSELVRRAKYSNIQRVQNIWTAQTIEMVDVNQKSRTILAIEKLQYNLPMKDENFTLQAMRREP
jgi:Outer membrane lipoprotein-sorting protein